MTATMRAFIFSGMEVSSCHSFILFWAFFYFNGPVWGRNFGPFGTKCDPNVPPRPLFHKWMLDLITTHNLGVPSCLNTTLVHWNLFGFFNGWAMENKMYKVILLVFMNQGCAINLEHISILLELSPMDKSSTIFHWSGVTSTKWIDLSER